MKAFPSEWVEVKPNTLNSSYVSNYQEIKHSESGMELRDYFAAKAMQSLSNNNDMEDLEDVYCEQAYRIADAMMKAREKK